MLSTKDIITSKFLSVCSPQEAVQWLKSQRDGADEATLRWGGGRDIPEEVLARRNDTYIDFGLARYGTSSKAGRQVYARGDLAIRCTYLAHFPNGGFSPIGQRYDLSHELPSKLEELCALVGNSTLSDTLLESVFKKKGMFEHLNEENYQAVLWAASENERLWTPYDDTYLDGFAEHLYHSVFRAAWDLTATAPNTMPWASLLYHLLYRCLPPISFDPKPIFARWHLKSDDKDDGKNSAYFLRWRLADVMRPDDELLKSSDKALRQSFYRRFNPARYPQWPNFAGVDGEDFLEPAISNPNLWRKTELRSALGELCWAYPDPDSRLDMPNSFRATEKRMRTEHPEWFKDED